MIHFVFFPGNGEAWRLMHVHLLEVAIEECGLHFHVMDSPSFLGSQREEDTDRLHARHGGKRVVVVDAFLLNEAARHQPRLVLGHRALLILL